MSRYDDFRVPTKEQLIKLTNDDFEQLHILVHAEALRRVRQLEGLTSRMRYLQEQLAEMPALTGERCSDV